MKRQHDRDLAGDIMRETCLCSDCAEFRRVFELSAKHIIAYCKANPPPLAQMEQALLPYHNPYDFER